MEQIIMGALVLTVVLVVNRKQAFVFRWQPDRGTWVAIGTGMLAAVLSTSLLWLGSNPLFAHLVLYGGIWLLCGIAIPWGYVLLVERDSLSGLGLRKEKSRQSFLIGLALAAFFSLVILFQADFSILDWVEVGRSAVVLILAGGLFELFLYYGFIHIRLQKAFGTIPAILLTAILYVLWHIGTQLTLEADPWLAAIKLLGVGIMYQAVFSLTYNLLVIWPFFFGAGVMIDFMVNIGEMQEISAGFPWATGTIAAMLLVMWGIWAIWGKGREN
jgi:membrane protease YdiL (CAAX protease family)